MPCAPTAGPDRGSVHLDLKGRGRRKGEERAVGEEQHKEPSRRIIKAGKIGRELSKAAEH